MIVIASLLLLALAIFLMPKEIRAAAAPSAAGEALTKNYLVPELREIGPRGLMVD
jgi:hypothetical protein